MAFLTTGEELMATIAHGQQVQRAKAQRELREAAQEAADALYHALWVRSETENLPNQVRSEASPALDRLRAALAGMEE